VIHTSQCCYSYLLWFDHSCHVNISHFSTLDSTLLIQDCYLLKDRLLLNINRALVYEISPILCQSLLRTQIDHTIIYILSVPLASSLLSGLYQWDLFTYSVIISCLCLIAAYLNLIAITASVYLLFGVS
jgi:hypothetical protein